ncbi:MAG: 16S rRNA (adenine(1518)-N(6)/adenine(1519)-N(6))-dimethyltransferase RsmA [Cytophagales bacterium]|nr:16S rRNA (adenine(1518)-N(6)/adenine(1519)-N(6))-dimethyltransferase RsmA [Cytophagales bacterium]
MSHHLRNKGHIPRKRFGQHFLSDAVILGDIVDAIAPNPQDFMVEIGPGLGAMTLPLLAHLEHLTVVELDRDLALRLRQNQKITVIESDVLKVDFAALALGAKPKQIRVVGNLPYNISSPILFHLLAVAHLVQDQHFMLQKEVIDRMVAAPSTSDYGRLSVMLQWRYEMQSLFNVPPACFDPPPRVMSAIVRMTPRTVPAVLEVERLSEIVRVAFSQRRKLLRHTLGRWLEGKNFAGAFDVQRRAEEVPVSEYIHLAQTTV